MHWRIAAIASAALVLGACGGDDEGDEKGDAGSTATTTTQDTPAAVAGSSAAPDRIAVKLEPRGGSGVAGTATLTAEGDKTRVVVRLPGDDASEPHPAHIHAGTCSTFDAVPTYPLKDVTDGSSETVINTPFDAIEAEALVLNVHESAARMSSYLSCGVVSTTGAPRTYPLAAVGGSGVTGTATLSAEGDRTRVVVVVSGDATTVAHPTHVHDGSCAEFDPAPAHPLSDVVSGRSVTVLDVPLDDLTDEPYVVNVHESASALETYLACGEIS